MAEKLPPSSPIQDDVEMTPTDKQQNGSDTPEPDNKPVYTVVELLNAVRYGTRTHVSFILDTNKNLIEQYDEQGSTCFHWAAIRGDYDILQLLKSYYGSVLDVPAKCDNQSRPQHWAVSAGRIDSLRFFLENRMNINCLDANGCTPLLVAAQYQQTNAVLYLVKNGGDLTVKDNDGDNALHWAAYSGAEELVGLLLYFMPRELDSEDNFGQTPLHLASAGGFFRVVQFLLIENGAACNKKDKNGFNPLELSMNKGHVKCEYVIRTHKATGTIDLLHKMGWHRIKARGMLPLLIGGLGDRERGIWLWRGTFFPNLLASMISIYYATLPSMADLSLLQLLSTIFQMLWWACFMLILYFPPSYVSDVGGGSSSPDGGTNNNPYSTYSRALDRIVEVLANGNPMASMSQNMPNVCHTCHVVRPLRSKHDKVMRRCIHKFDHYCPFVHNAVCRDNYKYFIGVITLFPICYFLFMISTFFYWHRGAKLSWWFILFLLYSTVLCLMVGSLARYHFGLLTTNLTTNEDMNLQRYVYMHNEFSRYSNPFDKGSRWLNMMDGLWPSPEPFFTREAVLASRRAEKCDSHGKMVVNSVEEEESFFEEAKTKLIAQ